MLHTEQIEELEFVLSTSERVGFPFPKETKRRQKETIMPICFKDQGRGYVMVIPAVIPTLP